jgi:hypothetical protein
VIALDLGLASVGFNWEGFDDGGTLWRRIAELLDDGSIESELAYHSADEAVLKAKRDTSSTACCVSALPGRPPSAK